MTTDRERLIRDYVAAYNRFDVDAMLAQLHDDVRFEHASDGVVALAVTGKDAFAELARQAADAFAEREQVITELTIDGDTAVAVIDYRALPKGGDELCGKGRSLFTFRDGRIAVLRDEA